jgi:hypothetical protein
MVDDASMYVDDVMDIPIVLICLMKTRIFAHHVIYFQIYFQILFLNEAKSVLSF